MKHSACFFIGVGLQVLPVAGHKLSRGKARMAPVAHGSAHLAAACDNLHAGLANSSLALRGGLK